MDGTGVDYDYGMRIYDARIGKFLSVDPLTPKYPWYTPYQFAGNTPVQAVDLDGKEELHYTRTTIQKGNLTISTLTNTSVKQLASTNIFGQKYPGGQARRAVVEYQKNQYHIGFAFDDPDAMFIFDIWKQHPNARNFEDLFPSDNTRDHWTSGLTTLYESSRNYFLEATFNMVPMGFKDFESVQFKQNPNTKQTPPGAKELNEEVKKISDGGGTPQLERDGTQTIYQGRTKGTEGWKGALNIMLRQLEGQMN